MSLSDAKRWVDWQCDRCGKVVRVRAGWVTVCGCQQPKQQGVDPGKPYGPLG